MAVRGAVLHSAANVGLAILADIILTVTELAKRDYSQEINVRSGVMRSLPFELIFLKLDVEASFSDSRKFPV